MALHQEKDVHYILRDERREESVGAKNLRIFLFPKIAIKIRISVPLGQEKNGLSSRRRRGLSRLDPEQGKVSGVDSSKNLFRGALAKIMMDGSSTVTKNPSSRDSEKVMSTFRLAFVLLFALLVSRPSAVVQEKAAPPKVQEPDQARLIETLGSDKAAERKAASEALEKLGEAALPALRKALTHKDAEVRRAARELIEAIEGKLASEARAAIEKADGSVEEYTEDGKVLLFVRLGGTKAKDSDLRYVRYLGDIGRIYLGETVTDKGLLHLKGMTTIRDLSVGGPEIKDESLAVLKTMPNLKLLSLRGKKVTDAGLVHLSELSELQYLDLRGTKITDQGLEHLACLRNLQTLLLDISGDGFKHLKDLEHLNSLCMMTSSSVTDEGLAFLKHLKRLEDLDLSFTKVSDAGLAGLKDMKSLRRLTLNSTKVTGPGLVHLKGMQNLEELDLRDTPLTDVGLSHLKDLKNLKKLSLESTRVTDEGLVHLKGLVNLKVVALNGTHVTEKGITELQKALPFPKTAIYSDFIPKK